MDVPRVAAGVDSRTQSSGADSTYVRAEMAMPRVAAGVDFRKQSSGAMLGQTVFYKTML